MTDLHEKILKFVRKEKDGCWTWTGGQQKQVYFKGKILRVYRALYLEKHPACGEHEIVRTCPNKGCVNPTHHEARGLKSRSVGPTGPRPKPIDEIGGSMRPDFRQKVWRDLWQDFESFVFEQGFELRSNEQGHGWRIVDGKRFKNVGFTIFGVKDSEAELFRIDITKWFYVPTRGKQGFRFHSQFSTDYSRARFYAWLRKVTK